MVTVDGFRLLPGALSPDVQQALVAAVFERLGEAPLYRPMTPGGKPMSVRMSNFGPLGWLTDRGGYRYGPHHPLTGRPWPSIPPVLLDLWREAGDAGTPPDACLVNLYRDGARMGLHQDRDEADFGFPVVSVSLGDQAVFRIARADGSGSSTVKLSSGDVCVLAGASRQARHGIDRVLEGSSSLIPGGGRLNLTLRRARPA